MEAESDEIMFYNVHSEPFSNFFAGPFEVDKKTYPTAEHYYQSKKFEGTPKEEEIRLASTIHAAHELGHSLFIDDKDWNERKEKVYFDAVYNKFSQNHELRSKLLSTKKRELICIDTDKFWGKSYDERER